MQTVVQIFKHTAHYIYQSTPFEPKNSLFSGEGSSPSPHLSLVGPSPRPNEAFWIRLCRVKPEFQPYLHLWEPATEKKLILMHSGVKWRIWQQQFWLTEANCVNVAVATREIAYILLLRRCVTYTCVILPPGSNEKLWSLCYGQHCPLIVLVISFGYATGCSNARSTDCTVRLCRNINGRQFHVHNMGYFRQMLCHISPKRYRMGTYSYYGTLMERPEDLCF